MNSSGDVIEAFLRCKERAEIVAALSSLDLPDCWAAAGVLRNTVWDLLHGYVSWTALEDVDIIYFDPDDVSNARDLDLESRLSLQHPGFRFSVKNQARMHTRNAHSAYRDSADAVFHWTETCTAIGIAQRGGRWTVLQPWGLDDLWQLVVRPTFDDPRNVSKVLERVKRKQWLEKWPQLRLWTQQDDGSHGVVREGKST